MKRKLAFLGAILLAAFIFTCEGNTYRTYALDEEDRAWIDEAFKALQEIVEEREVMAQVATVPSGQLVMIRDATVDESCQVWEKVSAYVNGKVYEGYIPRDNLACSDERFLEWEELYGMNPGAAVMLTAAAAAEAPEETAAAAAEAPEETVVTAVEAPEAEATWTWNGHRI